MKQTLKDFLAIGLNRLEKGQAVDGLNGKYQANCTSDFDCAVFNTKNEARAVWRAKNQEEKKERKEIR